MRWVVREATSEDAESIAIRRVEFLAEEGHDFDRDELRPAVAAYLKRAITAGDVKAFVADADGDIVATGVVTIYERMMWEGVGREGYVLSMYTVPAWRKQGVGAAMVEAITSFARAEDIKLALIATDSGRTLYERAGFRPDERYMRWRP